MLEEVLVFPFPHGQVQSSDVRALGTRKAVSKVFEVFRCSRRSHTLLFHLLCSGGSTDGEREVREVRMLCRLSRRVAKLIVGMTHDGSTLPSFPGSSGSWVGPLLAAVL